MGRLRRFPASVGQAVSLGTDTGLRTVLHPDPARDDFHVWEASRRVAAERDERIARPARAASHLDLMPETSSPSAVKYACGCINTKRNAPVILDHVYGRRVAMDRDPGNRLDLRGGVGAGNEWGFRLERLRLLAMSPRAPAAARWRWRQVQAGRVTDHGFLEFPETRPSTIETGSEMRPTCGGRT